MKVLHFSHFNTVNVPYTYCAMYRRMGHHARLLTLYRHRGNIPEDICLGKKPFNPPLLSHLRRRRERSAEQRIRATSGAQRPVQYLPANPFESALVAVRDWLRRIEFSRLATRYDLFGFDLYHFHGGIEFFRNGHWVRKLAAMGKPVICNYHGPDLRTRGVSPPVDRASMLNLTNEFDLLPLHPDLHYIPIPYDCSHLPAVAPSAERLRIIHTPSVPAAKGTHLIEPVLRRVASERNVEAVVLTGVSHERVIEEKSRSHIAVEQVGNFGGTGYGVNSLETLAMGIPTVTEFTPEYERFLSGHPFVLATAETLHDVLLRLIDNEALRRDMAATGRAWVERQHGFATVWQVLLDHVREKSPELAGSLAAQGQPAP